MAFPKFTFKNFGEKLQQAVLRFPLTIAAILTFAVLMIIQIHNNFKDRFDERLWWMLGLTILLSLAFYLFAEKQNTLPPEKCFECIIDCLCSLVHVYPPKTSSGSRNHPDVGAGCQFRRGCVFCSFHYRQTSTCILELRTGCNLSADYSLCFCRSSDGRIKSGTAFAR